MCHETWQPRSADTAGETLAFTAAADDQLRNVQTELKNQGFYYGDVNGATDPDELTAQAGCSILIPLASGIPAGARNG